MNIRSTHTLKHLVYDLALQGGRMVGTAVHDRARTFLGQKLADLKLQPYRGNSFELPYHRKGEEFCNLVGVVPGRNRDLKPVLIGAHYDSVIPHPCADDNAAAVAITAEAAHMLREVPPERDTVIALFDAEEPPYYETPSMGSIRFYKDQMKPEGVHVAVVMDLVGHDLEIPTGVIPHGEHLSAIGFMGIPIPYLRNLLFITGAESHPDLSDMLKEMGRSLCLPTVFTLNSNVGDMSDHGIFRRSGVPYLFLSCGRWQHYHEPTDIPSRLNYSKMVRITHYLVKLVRSLAEQELKPTDETESDTATLEISSLKRTFGPALPLVLKKIGVGQLRGREDLDALADVLLSWGL